MEYPFIDTKKLTDDQLMDKIQKCQRILNGEATMGHTSMVDSARLQLETYRFEWNERMQSRMMKERFEKDKDQGPLEFGVVKEYYDPNENEDKEE